MIGLTLAVTSVIYTVVAALHTILDTWEAKRTWCGIDRLAVIRSMFTKLCLEVLGIAAVASLAIRQEGVMPAVAAIATHLAVALGMEAGSRVQSRTCMTGLLPRREGNGGGRARFTLQRWPTR